VAYPEPFRDGVGHVTVGLHRDHCVTGFQLAVIQVRNELIQRFGADAARETVLEEQQRSFVSGRERAIEVVHS
jgi:hypothetical protein